jgi:hypothetical protein
MEIRPIHVLICLEGINLELIIRKEASNWLCKKKKNINRGEN